MKELRVSRSTVERRLRLTRIPTQTVEGRTTFDLETLVDAWEQRRSLMESEKEEREKATESSITVSIPRSMRDDLDILSKRHGTSVAAVVRELLGTGLRS